MGGEKSATNIMLCALSERLLRDHGLTRHLTKGKGEEVGEGGKKDGGEKREKKGSGGRSKKDKEGERSSRGRRGDEEKERASKRGGKSGRSERRSERKRDGRRSAADGPPSGWKQLKDMFGGEWKGEKIPHRTSGSREDRERDRRGSRRHGSRSRDHKRSGLSSHRSRSGSADVHRRPQPSPFFVAKGAKHGEKEFPLRLLRHTRTRPPLTYCENPETAAPPRPPTRKEAFASEPPEVVRIMRLLAEAGLEKETEGRENSKEASGLAALRVSYEGGDEEEADDEQKRSDRSWFLTLAAFLSDGSSSAPSAKVVLKRSTSPEDLSPMKDGDAEGKDRDEDGIGEDRASVDSDVSMKEEPRDDSDAKAEEESEEDQADEDNEEEEEMVVKDEIPSVNEVSEPTVHSKWDSDNESGGSRSAAEDGGRDEVTPSPEMKKEQPDASGGEEEGGDKEAERMEVKEEEEEEEVEEEGGTKEGSEERREEVEEEKEGGEKVEDGGDGPRANVDGRIGSERSAESEASGMESEGEGKKGQQLASEYEEFMKAVSVGEEDDEDDAWEDDRVRDESAEVSDHRDSDSSGRKPSKPHPALLNRPSDVEMASDAPSSDDEHARRKIVHRSSSINEANRNLSSKEEIDKADEKAVSLKEKNMKRKERSKRDISESEADSDAEVEIPKKKRKTSGKKVSSVGDGIRKKTGGDRKKKLKTKEKSDRKRKERERKRKRKKKDRRKKKGRKRRDDSSDVDSESEEDEEEGSEGNERAVNTKGSRSKASDGVHKRQSHRAEVSSDEASSDSSSDSSDEADRRKPRKKKRKKRKKHEKCGLSKEDEDEMSDEEGEGKKGKPHSSHKKRSKDTKNKHHRDSDNSDGSEDDEHGTVADEKSKSAVDSAGGKENGVESIGKRGRKQKLKERGRKKKRKSSPPSLKKHASSRRRSPSTSDGSPTPGRGSRGRGSSVSKTQGSRGGTSEGGPSSVESNSSGGTKKHGDNTVHDRKPSECVSQRDIGRAEASSGQRKSHASEREGRRSQESGKSKASKAPPPSLSKSSGSAAKEKGVRAGTSVRKSSKESVSKKRAAEQSLNMSSSSSSSSPSSLSLSSVSSSSSSTESSSSASSDSHSISSSSSSSSSSASSSASSNSSSSSSSESSSSLSSFVNSPSSLNVAAVVMGKSEPKILKKDNNQPPPLVSQNEFAKSGPMPGSPEPCLSDISFSSLSRDSWKLQEGQVHPLEETLLKPNRTSGEKSRIQVSDRKGNSQMNNSPRKRSECGAVESTNAPAECPPSEARPAGVVRMDRVPESLIDPPESRGHACGPVGGGEKVQLDQRDNNTPLNSTSKTNLVSRESKPVVVNPELVSLKLCSEDDLMNGKILGDKGVSSSPSQPSRPSRWDTRPIVSESQVIAGGASSARESAKESHPSPSVTVPVLPVLPVPFPTCRDKPLEEIPLPSAGSVPQPVASPWALEASHALSSLVTLELHPSINPVCGLADSTISDSDLAGEWARRGGGLLQTVSDSSPSAKKVSLDKPYAVADNRPTSLEREQSVSEQFPVDSNQFLKTRVNRYQNNNQQSGGDKSVESATSVFSVDKQSLAECSESAALSGDTECVMSPEEEQPPTDWDDPEAFVGPGLSEIKSHVIQVGNFLQVVPSEQPMVPFPTPPTPVVPPPAVQGAVPPVPVPPAAPMAAILPVAPPSQSVSPAFPAPISPVKVFQAMPHPAPLMPATSQTLAPDPAPSPPPSSTLPSTPPSPPSAPLISELPSAPSTLSQLPLLASLAPSSSCNAISQLPLDPATILGTLISHALALEKQQKQQQQNLVHSPVCSPLIGGENEDVARESPRAMTHVERQARRAEKRRKMGRGPMSSQQQQQLNPEKFPVEDAMSNTDPLTNAMTEEYCIDPEEVALIQEAMSKAGGGGEEEDEEEFEGQSVQVCRVKEKRKKPKVALNTKVLPAATRGILIPPGLREKPSFSSGGTGLNSGSQGQRKSVMFADGIRPGEGTSPSAGEDLPSPPPPVRKVPKEKRLRKKKKIKVKIIRQIRMESTEEDEDEDDDASPPPPPPGSPPPSLLLHHHLSTAAVGHQSIGEVPIPNPAAHYPYPSAPTTHAFSQPPPTPSQPPLNPAPPMSATGGSALPPNALPRIPQWAPCN
ncbi:serine-rich adhesin for platelets-like [Ischnura elegans]|uniref:serine-rich adhesin for platelets-like n=1 Tax=Ischnura elegans TaxID=197161 RepID=UPI001ED89DE5|nr:serine-rich adhesin for platelets-like [Ischnura elegans]